MKYFSSFTWTFISHLLNIFFKVNSGEYRVMGLAPYGTPNYVDKIYDYLMDVKEDGSFQLNLITSITSKALRW